MPAVMKHVGPMHGNTGSHLAGKVLFLLWHTERRDSFNGY